MLLVAWLATAGAFAQTLDENCTVSVLNRTANVRPDGSWRIDNIPANFGLVRARVPAFTQDRYLAPEIAAIKDLVQSGGFNDMMPAGLLPSVA